MIALLIGAALAQATAQSAGAEPAVSVTAAEGRLRASQIALVPASRDTVVATMPEGAGEVAMSEATRLDLVRNRYPGARYRLRHDGPVRIVRHAPPLVSALGADCAATRTSIPAGAFLAADELGPVRCERRAAGGWLGYDAVARSYFATREIPAGTYLGRVSAALRPAAIEGAELLYRTSEGPVTIEREVVALQSSRAGRRVFVRTEDGKVLSAALAGAEESE